MISQPGNTKSEPSEKTRSRGSWRRKIGMTVAAAGLAGTGLVATAPAAHAAGPCTSGYACIFTGYPAPGVSTVYRNAGNANPNITMPAGGYVWNNGHRQAGVDHIQLNTRFGGYNWTICLHYGAPVMGGDPTVAELQDGETVTSWRWRGECGANEDSWHIV